MRKKLIITLMLCLTLSACGTTNDSNVENQQVEADTNTVEVIEQNSSDKLSEYDWGITLSTKDASPTGLVLTINQSGGNPTGELEYGADYKLIPLIGEKWEDVPTLGEGVFTEEAYTVAMGTSTDVEINWEWLYGRLPVGEYRIVKRLIDFRSTGDYDTDSYWADFEITETKTENYPTINLPAQYIMGDFVKDIGVAGAVLFLPEAYTPLGKDMETFEVDSTWYSAGSITEIPNAKEWFTYSDGIVQDKPYLFFNHTMEEKVKVIDDFSQFSAGSQLKQEGISIILYHSSHDLYTVPELANLEEQGISLSEAELCSEYWDFYVTKEGADRAFLISLCSKLFSREEAESIISTIELTSLSEEY